MVGKGHADRHLNGVEELKSGRAISKILGQDRKTSKIVGTAIRSALKKLTFREQCELHYNTMIETKVMLDPLLSLRAK